MADATARGDGITRLLDRLRAMDDQIRTLQMFDGTQNARAIERLRQLVNDLPGQITAAIGTLLTTAALHVTGNAQVDGTSTTNGSAGIGGNLSVGGTAAIAGVLTANAGMSSLDARNTTVINNRAAVWADVAGRFGNSSSSVEVKQDFEPVDPTPRVNAILTMAMLGYRRVEAVEQWGDDAPVEYGAIVEYVAKTPLADATFCNAEGAPQGINWADMVPSLIATVQALHAELKDARQRLDAAGL